MTTLLIADDQALVRVGLRKILENEPQTAVVGEAGDGQDAVAAARRLRPDVVLMDIRMPVLDGIEATRRIVRAQPSTRVLILTTFGLDDYVYDALRAGASGFMLKDAPPEEIAAAVRIVASGDALLAPAVTRAVIEEFTRIPVRAQPAVPPAVGELTPREREVLDLLIRGLSNPEICRELVVSEATAKTHVAKILQKLGVRDRVQAVIYAYETGLISPSPLSRVKTPLMTGVLTHDDSPTRSSAGPGCPRPLHIVRVWLQQSAAAPSRHRRSARSCSTPAGCWSSPNPPTSSRRCARPAWTQTWPPWNARTTTRWPPRTGRRHHQCKTPGGATT
jgi:DNA-binding NarL/FixJ family response regulator